MHSQVSHCHDTKKHQLKDTFWYSANFSHPVLKESCNNQREEFRFEIKNTKYSHLQTLLHSLFVKKLFLLPLHPP